MVKNLLVWKSYSLLFHRDAYLLGTDFGTVWEIETAS